MCPHPLCHLILTNPAGGHCQYPHFKDEQTISRGYDLSRCKSTAKIQTPDFCSLSLMLMLMKTLLICNLEIGTRPRDEELSWVVRLALMNSMIRLKGYYFFSFWKSQPQVTAGFSQALCHLPDYSGNQFGWKWSVNLSHLLSKRKLDIGEKRGCLTNV